MAHPQIVAVKLTFLSATQNFSELLGRRSQAVEEKVQGANPGRKNGAHLGAPFLHSSGPVLYGALVARSMESIYHIMLDITEGLKMVPFDIFFEIACIIVKKQINLHPWELESLLEQPCLVLVDSF